MFAQYIGKKINKLLILDVIPYHKENGKEIQTQAKCLCDCGSIKLITFARIKSGKQVSCGCYGKEIRLKRNFKHGLRSHNLYDTWSGINKRCYVISDTSYKYYGSRGIISFWKDDLIGFIRYIEDNLGPRPEGYSLDRINNKGNYEPGNLRWASAQEQALNRSKFGQAEIEVLKKKVDELTRENSLLKEELTK